MGCQHLNLIFKLPQRLNYDLLPFFIIDIIDISLDNMTVIIDLIKMFKFFILPLKIQRNYSQYLFLHIFCEIQNILDIVLSKERIVAYPTILPFISNFI